MVVVKRQGLLALNHIFGVIHIQHQCGWRLRKAGNELLYQSTAGAVNVARAGRVFDAVSVGAGCQRVFWIKRCAPGPQAKHRIMTQGLAIIAIFIAGGNLNDALCEQDPYGVLDITQMTVIRYC